MPRKKIEWSSQQQDEFLELIATGSSMGQACAAFDVAPATVYRMAIRDAEFQAKLTRARMDQQDAEMDKIIDMADEASTDDWQVVKLRIWARQWRAAKLAPKKYGERKVIAGDEEAPLTVQKIERVVVGD